MTTTTTDNWTALGWTLDHDDAGMNAFMFMGTAVGGSVYLYKHEGTRRYLNCDLGGNCYRYTVSGVYAPLGREAAIRHAFS